MKEQARNDKQQAAAAHRRQDDRLDEVEKRAAALERRLKEVDDQQQTMRSAQPTDSGMADISHRQEMLDQAQRRTKLVAHGLSEEIAARDIKADLYLLHTVQSCV